MAVLEQNHQWPVPVALHTNASQLKALTLKATRTTTSVAIDIGTSCLLQMQRDDGFALWDKNGRKSTG
ncbi:hypothetical protein KIF59_13770 [Enterobacter cloacae subsp. cloacae]|nr:hypothetical protein [Enterobacter cloacae subsp. cloacae]